MSNQSKRELVDRLRHRYLHGSRGQKIRILDEFAAVTGMHREAAIHALGRGYEQGRERRGRRAVYTGRGISTTKAGTLLKQSIAVPTFADWNDVVPGFMGIDLVAHRGETTEGFYLSPLTAAEVATGWTECMLPPQRAQSPIVKLRLYHPYRQLNPAALRWQLDATLKDLWQLAE